MRRTLLGLVGLLSLMGVALAAPVAAAPDDAALVPAVADPARAPANRARDGYRHPLQTLQFFGVRADMKVVEIWPGQGWYTEILAPYLKARGEYIGAVFALQPGSPAYQGRLTTQWLGKLAAEPTRYDAVGVTALGGPDRWTIAPAASADRVLTFRNVHNWLADDTAPQVFAAMFAALKPGGELGVVEHRAAPGTSLQQMKDSGYVTVEQVRQLAEAAGFRFVATSEINANPRDTKDYPEGVWTLPPVLALKDKDREKYLAIGESDRMTLRFVKP